MKNGVKFDYFGENICNIRHFELKYGPVFSYRLILLRKRGFFMN